MRSLCASLLVAITTLTCVCSVSAQTSAGVPPQLDGRRIQNAQPEEMWKRVDKCVLPAYPPLALAARVSGTVAIGLCASPQGAVTNYRLLAGHPTLAPAALEAIKEWTFQPAEGPACSRVRALIKFEPNGTVTVALAHAILPDDFGDPGIPDFQPMRDTTVVAQPLSGSACETISRP